MGSVGIAFHACCPLKIPISIHLQPLTAGLAAVRCSTDGEGFESLLAMLIVEDEECHYEPIALRRFWFDDRAC
jgi:hypothetical protein